MTPLRRSAFALVVLLAAVPLPVGSAARAAAPVEPPALAPLVAAGKLPPVAERLPDPPAVAALEGKGRSLGEYGGSLKILMGRQKDIRMMMVYGYARLVGYDRDLNLVPDIVERVEVEDERAFTFHLRRNHRWSDGHPFTAEDFRYYWEDVVNNEELSPFGPP
ncbi:MAG: ABC transporter substrate-binding protein, partial [Kiloniellaceae bacterium]